MSGTMIFNGTIKNKTLLLSEWGNAAYNKCAHSMNISLQVANEKYYNNIVLLLTSIM